MLIVVSILVSIATIELAVIIWLLICLLKDLNELEHHKKPPHPRPCL